MTENITGAVVTASVGASLAGIFSGTPPARDALLITNNTIGTRVFVNDVNQQSRQFPISPGETASIPFASGQVYAFATASTDDGELLANASIEIRPILVDSSLERELSSLLGSLVPVYAEGMDVSCGQGYKFDRTTVAGTDLTGTNGSLVRIRGVDLSGRTLEARSDVNGSTLSWVTVSEAISNEVVRVEMVNIPDGYTVINIVAVDGADVLALFQGRVKGI